MKIPSGKFSSTKKVPGKNKKKRDFEPLEEFFWDFWPTVDKEVKRERLEQELLALKKESYIENVHHWQQWSHLHC